MAGLVSPVRGCCYSVWTPGGRGTRCVVGSVFILEERSCGESTQEKNITASAGDQSYVLNNTPLDLHTYWCTKQLTYKLLARFLDTVALARRLGCLACRPSTPGLQVRSPVGEHTRINRECTSEWNNSDRLMFLPPFLLPSLSYSVKRINKLKMYIVIVIVILKKFFFTSVNFFPSDKVSF